MSDDQPRPRSLLAVWLIVGALLLPVAYALSAGPAVWLYNHGYLGEWTANFYTPLDLACEYFQPLRQARDWYLSLWT